MKKILALVVAMLLVAAMLTTAFAGTLTVKNSETGTLYKFYKIFDLTGKSTTGDATYEAVSYTIDPDWSAFFTGDGAAYIVDTNSGSLNPIVINGTTKYINITESNKVAFTNDAMKWALANATADTQVEGATGSSVEVDIGDALGYYLMVPVDAATEKTNPLTTGTVASLTSTIPDADIYVKATKPTIEKTDNQVTVDVGQTVTYEITGTVPNTSGTTDYYYALHDTWTEGLTFQNDIAITIGGTAVDATTAAGWITYTAANREFTVVIPVENYQDHKGEQIKLTYHAKVNEAAVETDQEHNEAKVIYGRTPGQYEESTPVREEVYTAKIIINKYYDSDPADTTKKLANAEFVLMNSEGKFYNYTEVTDGDECDAVSWVTIDGAPAVATIGSADITDAQIKAIVDAKSSITTKITNNDGAAEFPGLADGTYYLIEIAAPNGYNRLNRAQSVTLTGTNVDDTTHLENHAYADTNFDAAVNAQADVENKTGTQLPSTGGIGTTIFYVVGGILVLGAVIFLVTKRRMGSND